MMEEDQKHPTGSTEHTSASDERSSTGTEPRGFGEHTRGLAGEYAHEQGWGLNEEERRAEPQDKQATDGGNDYDYGARDFGDEAVDTGNLQPSPKAIKALKKD